MHSYSSRITEASPSYKLFKYRRVEPFYVMRSSYRNSHWQHRKKWALSKKDQSKCHDAKFVL